MRHPSPRGLQVHLHFGAGLDKVVNLLEHTAVERPRAEPNPLEGCCHRKIPAELRMNLDLHFQKPLSTAFPPQSGADSAAASVWIRRRRVKDQGLSALPTSQTSGPEMNLAIRLQLHSDQALAARPGARQRSDCRRQFAEPQCRMQDMATQLEDAAWPETSARTKQRLALGEATLSHLQCKN